MSDKIVIVCDGMSTAMISAIAVAITQSKLIIVNCDSGQIRGINELEQSLKQITDDGNKTLKKLITGDMFKGLLPEEPEPVRKEKPYYRRFEKRKF